LALGLILIAAFPGVALTEEILCRHNPPYEAPEHVTPPAETPESKLRLKDNEDGTLIDPDSRLMWTQKDSYSDLNKCLTYTESLKYVENLETAGHTDWRIPTPGISFGPGFQVCRRCRLLVLVE
jgi:hypothetical protein